MPDMKMSAGLPQDLEDNGLYVLKRQLIAKPGDQHVIVAVVDCKSVTRDYADGSITVAMRVLAAEAIGERDEETARRLMRRAKETRQGATVLPLQYESDIDALGRDDG